MEALPVEARPAATVMLIRDYGDGIEVLMVRRRLRGFFGGLTVEETAEVLKISPAKSCPVNTPTRRSALRLFASLRKRPGSR